MTSREATPMLARGGTTPSRLADTLISFLAAPAQSPWLLRSLWGGTKAEKARLLERLDLPADALPNLGSWKADTGLLHLIVDKIFVDRPEHVVELGSGASTLVIARALAMAGGGRLHSYDQHADFVAATRDWLADHGLSVDLRTAPLTTPPSAWPGLWYDLEALPPAIDLLIVDGPHWTLHPMVRGAAETLFARISSGGSIILDDAARPGERLVARRWKRDWPDFDWSFRPGIKGTLIGTRR